jgi:hypothetical protein
MEMGQRIREQASRSSFTIVGNLPTEVQRKSW